MKLTLFVDIHERKLVRSATSDFPVTLPTLFREDHIELEITLLEPIAIEPATQCCPA